MYITSLWIIYFITGSLYLLVLFTYFVHPPTTSLLWQTSLFFVSMVSLSVLFVHLQSKENHQQNEKISYWTEEDICKYLIRHWYPKYTRNSCNSIALQKKAPKDPVKKWAEKMSRLFFFQWRHTNGQLLLEKAPSIINNQWNANQSHNEISLHRC